MNWIWAIVLGAVAATGIFFWVYKNDSKKLKKNKAISALLRSLSTFLIVLLLCAPFITFKSVKEVKPQLTLLVDRSTSMKSYFTDSSAYENEVKNISKALAAKYDVTVQGFGNNLIQDSIWQQWQYTTSIGTAFQQLQEQHKVKPVQGVLLLSDGINNLGVDPSQIANQMSFPVHTLALGDSTTPVDASIKNVLVNKTVSLNARFEMLIDLEAHKLEGQKIKVSVTHNGNTVAEQQLSISKTSQVVSLPLELVAQSKGMQKYSIQITPLEAEQNILNNRQDVFIDVIDEKIKVLLFAKGAHPDVAAIRAALQHLEQFEITVSKTLPSTAIYQNDIVIAHQPTSSECNVLEQSGRPVWYILGATADAHAYAALGLLAQTRSITGDVDIQPVLNRQFGNFQLTENIVDVISKYPPLRGSMASLKPQESVLFYQKVGNVNTEQPLWFFMNQDAGRSLVLIGEGLWKWKMQEFKHFKNITTFQTIIKQSLLQIHKKEDKRPFAVYVDKQVYSTYEKVFLYAMYKDNLGVLNNIPNVSYKINNAMPAQNMDRIGNTYKQDLGMFAEGKYNITASIKDKDRVYNAEAIFEVSPFDLEAARTHADFGLMKNIASNSGGSFYSFSDKNQSIDAILNHAASATKLKEDIKEQKLINFKWLFFMLLILMTLDWWFRKNNSI